MNEQLATTLENSESYTLSVAEAMPENGYATKPAEEVWNFEELMNHIAYGILWWTDTYIRKKETPWNPPPSRKEKAEIIAYLKEAYQSLSDLISNESFTGDKLNGFYATMDHVTHHRGQATIYLRINHIIPPEYKY